MMLSYLILVGLPLCMAYIHDSGYQCPDTWEFDQRSLSCVKPFKEKKKWNLARKSCVAEGGDLAVIRNRHTTATIRGMLRRSKHYWIGLFDKDNDGVYTYVDGSALGGYKSWAKNEPSNHGGNEKCVEMIANKVGAWNDKKCSKKRAYVCQMPAKLMLQCPPDWQMLKEEKTCVLVFDQKMTWHHARASCQNSGGDLVKVYKKKVSQFVRNQLLKKTRYWVGAWDENKDDIFEYVDGEKIGKFNRWARKEPNNLGGNERCMEVIGNRRVSWNDKRCSKKRKFVCQRPTDIASNTLDSESDEGSGSEPIIDIDL